ncbi:methyltransferase family protein [Agarivorans sp. MS3-6]|uniref:methyltransferase family protein n=1 Tax=Agarivorans sp. TSD2052 TaxID=2937286 RepID=UPI00200E8AF4|nr:isoprenylcysteine carboxylmethyltransferase family protein [Agarivorans sp. TSD2052]UPW17694.1 isoprenylcysteine carboxylmethyltransferase family protein [Agarivorans sp. TSD2052]
MLTRMQLLIPPPVWLMMAMGLAYVFSWLNHHFIAIYFPQWLISLRWAIVTLACGIASISVFGFFKARTTINPHHPERSKHLLVDGIYRFSRNPMYLSLVMLLLAWCLHLQAILSLFSIAWFVYAINQYQIKPEEVALREHFGEAYQQYCGKVRRWL